MDRRQDVVLHLRSGSWFCKRRSEQIVARNSLEEEFGNVLRPVLQRDEWKLVVAGGVIGTIIGALQVIHLFGGSF